MSRRRQLVTLVMVSLIGLVGLVGMGACSGDGGPTGSTTATGRGDPMASDGADTFSSLLHLVDVEAWAGGYAHLADWRAIADEAGVDAPTGPDETEAWLEALTETTEVAFTGSPFWLGDSITEADAFRTAFGVDVGQVDASIVAGPPPEVREAYLGRFDPLAVDAAVRADDEWSGLLEVVTTGDDEFYSWSPDGSIVGQPGPGRPLGVGGNLFVSEDQALWVHSSSAMERMLAARDDVDLSLAGIDDLALAAEVLDERNAYTAALAPADELTSDDERAPLATYRVLAIGNAFEEDGQVGIIVLVNDDEDVAAENAERLRTILDEGESATSGRPWSEILEVGDVSADGRLTVAEVEIAEHPSVLFDAFFRRDSIYLHDG